MNKVNLDVLKKEVKILDVATNLGYTLQKVGNKYRLREHDSVMITSEKNLYNQFSTGKGGSVIDFAMNFGQMTYPEAINYLADFHGGFSEEEIKEHSEYKKPVQTEKAASKEKEELKRILPQRSPEKSRVYAYLHKTRGISYSIIDELYSKNMLYQDVSNNCVFVSYDEYNEPRFCCLRGTNTKKKFIADNKGNDYAHSFFIDNKSNELIITESVIDALSVMCILDKDRLGNHKTYNYIALSGVGKYKDAIDYHLIECKEKYDNIFLCLDSDQKGQETVVKIKKHIESLPLEERPNMYNAKPPKELKDYNDILRCYREINCTEEEKRIANREVDAKINGFSKARNRISIEKSKELKSKESEME